MAPMAASIADAPAERPRAELPAPRSYTVTNGDGMPSSDANLGIASEAARPLEQLDWVTSLRAQPGMTRILTAGALLSPDNVLGDNHLFCAMLRNGMLRDLDCLYEAETRTIHQLFALGDDVCGHRGITHGGITATIMDDTLGTLVYMVKKSGALPPGPALTARLEVDYKKPLPAGSDVCASARLTSVEGRKAWAEVTLAERPNGGGTVFSLGKALFIVPRQQPAALASDGADAK